MITRSLIHEALVNADIDTDYTVILEGYKSWGQESLALQLLYRSDAVRFMTELAFLLIDRLGDVEGRAVIRKMASDAYITEERGHNVLCFSGFTDLR